MAALRQSWCKGTNKRAKSKRKIVFSYAVPSESTFGVSQRYEKNAKTQKKDVKELGM
jgi:hypothetical protein